MKKNPLFIGFLGLAFFLLPNKLHAATLTGEAEAKTFGKVSVEVPGVTIGDLGSAECDENAQSCLLKGLSWSDVIGWMAWDGQDIRATIQNKGGIFPSEFFPKMTFNGSLGGFLWGEKTGWIQLSSCVSQNENDCKATPYCSWSGSYCELDSAATLPPSDQQNAHVWGVYLDLCSNKKNQATCESALNDPYCNWDVNQSVCVFDQINNPKGQPFRGFAWSQYLGWIKFGLDLGETGFKGVFSSWPATDLTPPEVPLLPEHAWIPNQSPIGTIAWTDFAQEKNSTINVLKSDIDYTLDGGVAYAGCNPQGNNASALIFQQGESVNLYFPGIGLVDETVLNHHCKYDLTGVLYNNSNIGYFFGSDAEKRAEAAGIDLKSPEPNVINSQAISLYTMAGAFDGAGSSLSHSGTPVSDGIDSMQVLFSPRDIGGNPIVAIPFDLSGQSTDPANAVRNVYLGYDLDASKYFFDSVEPANNFLYSYPSPLLLGIEELIYDSPGILSYPKNGPDENYDYLGGSYRLNLKGLAPAMSSNPLSVQAIDFELNSKAGLSELPALSPSMPAFNLVNQQKLEKASGLPLPLSINIKPALEVTDGNLNQELINLDQPVEATFTLKNNSHADGFEMNRFGVDHLIHFKVEGQENDDPSLETRDINLLPVVDAGLGRTDRKAQATRYELWQDNLGLSNLSQNEFHSPFAQFHPPNYSFEDDADGVDLAGQYESDGKLYASKDDLEPYPPTIIDRGDDPELKLPNESSQKYTFTFRPSQHIGQIPDSKVVFNIDQYVAYKPSHPLPQFAIYAATSFIDGIKLKNIGVGTQGVVTGRQVYEPTTSRDLNNITLTSSASLRKEMRKNVAQLTRNMNLDKCDVKLVSPLKSLPHLPSDCIRINESNKTIIAVYKGDALTLGDGQAIEIPKGYKYTLILADGTNLYLKENIFYSDSTSSFGIIALQNSQGKGGNVYVDPKPTNFVGTLYAEGSLLSSPDASGKNLFFGQNSPSINELSNQLLWQGSLATRNTIGGSASNTTPNGVDCSPWPDKESCAKAFDLDFLRRFTVYYLKEANIYYAPSNALFSGGGSCTNNMPIDCSAGNLPTTVDLSGPNSTIDPNKSRSINTVYVEPNSRPIPLGFTLQGGFTNTQEIR